IYDFVKTGDEIVVYKTFDDLEIKKDFHPPVDPVRNNISNGVDLENFWIRQRFNNPYRAFWNYGGTANLKFDYYQHTGVDFFPNATSSEKLSVYAIDDGKIAKIQLNNGNDHGLGNTVIIEHQKIYSLYSHLASIETLFKEGDIIKKGEIIGEVGNSGYGCQNYWRIGEDGCPSTGSGQANNNPRDIHLHFEIKKAPVLENPEAGQERFYYGYVPDYPQKYGYLDPMEFLFEKKAN
ncbi:MAG: M23 family metallopeptidase, partial [bacterium]|nr:M23 family metallopeptidase [bacterium]